MSSDLFAIETSPQRIFEKVTLLQKKIQSHNLIFISKDLKWRKKVIKSYNDDFVEKQHPNISKQVLDYISDLSIKTETHWP